LETDVNKTRLKQYLKSIYIEASDTKAWYLIIKTKIEFM
jgi:hypothetical protein